MKSDTVCTVADKLELGMKKALVVMGVVSAVFSGMGTLPEAFAQSLADEKTQDLLIQKLTQVQLNLAPGDASKAAITLRLADLHAERARVSSMKELSSGCVVCNAGKEDRLKALSYYQEVLPRIPENKIGKVLAQVGHLYELTGNEKQAVATYERVINEQRAPEAVAEAHLSLAEVYFKRREFATAQKHYQAVLDQPQAASRGLAAYRLAWCEFNEGRLEAAIKALTSMLKSPELLTRSAVAGASVQVDRQFQEEVSRDLATFLARRPVINVADAQTVFDLSPETTRMSNVVYLASEVERLGQMPAAISLWRFALEKQAQPQARLESHVRLAQIEMEQKQYLEALKDFQAGVGLWEQLGTCNVNDCRELKTRLRKFVLDWNRVEKNQPTELLLSAYQAYLKVFAAEADMQGWAAKVASDLKQYALAVELAGKAAQTAKTQAASAQDVTLKKESGDRLESALLTAIEAAEISKDSQLLTLAYESYLNLSAARTKALEVQYQKARIVYDRSDYKTASVALRDLALSQDADKSPASVALRKQAADLALDALVLLKDDAQLETWALEFGQKFPSASTEFAAVARKSVLTQSAQQAASASPVGFEAAWKTLSRFDVSRATPEEKLAYHKNRLVLAEKMGRFQEAREAADDMLRQPSLSSTDQAYALSRKAWLAELVLDFDSALKATEKLSPSADLPASQRLLKLAMYADLAMKDSRPFYGQFLKESKDSEKNLAIVFQLARDSKEPLKEIEKNKALLGQRPELLADLYLELALRGNATEIAKKALATPSLRQTASGKLLSRMVLLADYSKLKAKISNHQIESSSQKKMASTLKARAAMLDEVEKLAGRAIESSDWTSQLVSLDLMSKQNERFYQEVLSLPVPQGLSPEEEQEYLQLLSNQAAPHQVRAADSAKKVSEFWANAQAIELLDQSLTQASGPMRKLVLAEVSALTEIAPDEKKAALVTLASKPEAKALLPSLASLESARQAVRENPLNRARLENLLSLEKQVGRSAMVAYLQGRIESLDSQNKEGVK